MIWAVFRKDWALLWPLAVLCPLLMLRQWRGATPRQAALRGYAYGVGLFGAGTWWLYISIHDMNDSPVWLAAERHLPIRRVHLR